MPENKPSADTSNWSGEGEFTQVLIDHLQTLPAIAFLRVEDAPASRSEADYNFISNEIFVGFATRRTHRAGQAVRIPARLTHRPRQGDDDGPAGGGVVRDADIGAPDYSDDGMLQYLRARTDRAAVPDARIQAGRAGADLRGRRRAASVNPRPGRRLERTEPEN